MLFVQAKRRKCQSLVSALFLCAGALVHGFWPFWRLIPHCVIWCLWRERNARHFEDHKRTILELKLFFFQTLYDWVLGLGIFSFHSLVELIDFCNF